MSTVEQDFDRIALVSEDGATCNNFYHDFLLRHLPQQFERALEVGCGAGTFSRRLAERAHAVTAIDISVEMIRRARESSCRFENLEYVQADINHFGLGVATFDCIASLATLHHLPYREVLLRLKSALKPGGTLLVLDLLKPVGVRDRLLNFVALPFSLGLRVRHHGRIRRPRAERDAWSAHEIHDAYLTINEVRQLSDEILPGAQVKKHLLWRYSLIWTKPV